MQTLTSMPGTLLNYARAALPKKNRFGEQLPNIALQLPNYRCDAAKLQKYREICGFSNNGTLPLSYPGVLAMPMQLELMLNKAFPFRVMGSVHLSNVFTQYKAIPDDASLDLRVSFDGQQPHELGTAFSLVTEVYTDGELAWKSVGLILIRDPKASPEKKPRAPLPALEAPTAQWELPSGLGFRYGLVSGDINPIHLFSLSAKVLGFKRHIIQGMWTAAKVAAHVQADTSDQCELTVHFKTPIYLPSKVELHTDVAEQGQAFTVRCSKDKRPHMEAQFRNLDGTA